MPDKTSEAALQKGQAAVRLHPDLLEFHREARALQRTVPLGSRRTGFPGRQARSWLELGPDASPEPLRFGGQADVGDVAAPDLVAALDRQPFEQVRKARVGTAIPAQVRCRPNHKKIL